MRHEGHGVRHVAGDVGEVLRLRVEAEDLRVHRRPRVDLRVALRLVPPLVGDGLGEDAALARRDLELLALALGDAEEGALAARVGRARELVDDLQARRLRVLEVVGLDGVLERVEVGDGLGAAVDALGRVLRLEEGRVAAQGVLRVPERVDHPLVDDGLPGGHDADLLLGVGARRDGGVERPVERRAGAVHR